MGNIIIEGWSESVQPGSVTIITIEDRAAAVAAAERAETARDAAEDFATAAKEWAQSGGAIPVPGTGVGGGVFPIRMVSGTYPKRNESIWGVLPPGAVAEWEGPTPPPIGTDYAIAGRDRWFVVDVT